MCFVVHPLPIKEATTSMMTRNVSEAAQMNQKYKEAYVYLLVMT